MATVEVPQTLEYKGGQLNAAPVLEVENFTNQKKIFICHVIGIKPQSENIISNNLFIPMAAGQRKPEGQWTTNERKAANLDQRLKSLIMSILLDDQMNSVINCLTTKSTWDYLILYHKGTFDVKESRVMDLKLCYNTFKFKEAPSSSSGKNKGLITETYDLDEEEVSSDDNESQRNTTDHLVVVFNSSMTDYDSTDKSLVCSTPLPPLEKLTGAEPISEPKTVKSILKSKSTFKDETLKGIIINEPSSAPVRGNKSSSASKTNSAPAEKLTGAEPVSRPKTVKSILKSKSTFKDESLKGITINKPSSAPVRGDKSSSASKTNSAPACKLKNVKIEDDPLSTIVMKEINELKLQFSKNKSSYFKNKNS
nr:hypothetical protein [Tanacetum cinerariifolium]